MTNVQVIPGDITRVPANALIMAVFSRGPSSWQGGVNAAVLRVAGSAFHDQFAQAMPRREGETVYAPAPRSFNGAFRSVLFVVDNWQRPLREVVLTALQSAENLRLNIVSMPAFRTEAAEQDPVESVRGLLQGIQAFTASKPTYVQKILFVIYQDQRVIDALTQGLRQISS